MAINELSLIAWGQFRGKLTRRQKEVYEILLKVRKPVTAAELARIIGRPINTISGRITELKRHGLILVAGRRKCHATGQTAATLKPYDGAEKILQGAK